MRLITLQHSTLSFMPNQDIRTMFNDGTSWGAYPHDTHHYHVITHRCGYGNNVWQYCMEHEFCHSFVAEYLGNKVSPVLWDLAHGNTPSKTAAAIEECFVQMFQRWLRANERPIIGDVDWDDMKSQALAYL